MARLNGEYGWNAPLKTAAARADNKLASTFVPDVECYVCSAGLGHVHRGDLCVLAGSPLRVGLIRQIPFVYRARNRLRSPHLEFGAHPARGRQSSVVGTAIARSSVQSGTASERTFPSLLAIGHQMNG